MPLPSLLRLAAGLMLLLNASFTVAEDAPASNGQKIYEETCDGCHGGGIGGWFSGAPKTGEKEEWAPLIEKGLPTLLESTLKGVGKMKPNGGCEQCTEADIRAAVEYMVEQSQ
ncbi:MAG TPA: cytochrome c5 family protein [Chromatiales bacterium]|nr:cytochrome c5 family protein [Chromatiales bacterium]